MTSGRTLCNSLTLANNETELRTIYRYTLFVRDLNVCTLSLQLDLLINFCIEKFLESVVLANQVS